MTKPNTETQLAVAVVEYRKFMPPQPADSPFELPSEQHEPRQAAPVTKQDQDKEQDKYGKHQ